MPSRVHPGEFYALPQSPQLFKQLLMIAGTDRYFQIVKCFRDEDLRADRQPEFTQVDVEMSFARPQLVFDLIEPLMQRVFARHRPRRARRRSGRMPYAEAIARYGSDKPDLRCGMEIQDLSAVFAETPFTPFRDALAARRRRPGVRRAGRRAVQPQAARRADRAGAAGGRVGPGLGAPRRGRGEEPGPQGGGRGGARAGARARRRRARRTCCCWRRAPRTRRRRCSASCAWRSRRTKACSKPDQFAFPWVTDFPMFEWDEEEKRFAAMHHPFTSPRARGPRPRSRASPGAVRAQAYDLVLNGSEIGGGSIRIHDSAVQARVFKAIGLTDEEARQRFGFFLQALRYGTPPHGGIALGLDRIVALLAGESSIREVIAFPKTAAAVDQMTGAPTEVDDRQLRELLEPRRVGRRGLTGCRAERVVRWLA